MHCFASPYWDEVDDDVHKRGAEEARAADEEGEVHALYMSWE